MQPKSLAGLVLALGLVAVSAASAQDAPPPGPGPGGDHPGGGRGAMRACHDDVAKLCAGVERGPAMMQCMRDHKDQLSDGCKTALAQAREHRRQDMQSQPQPDAPPN